MRRISVAVLALTAAAFGLRLAYLLHSHPFIDEFTTILAARSITELGVPVLPSGLFYEHGLLFSYLDAPFVAIADEQSLFSLARLPSLLIGTATVPLIYRVGRRWLSPLAGLVGAALLAFSPEGIVWGGRARMYALAQLLVLVLCLLVYEGSLGEGAAQPRIAPRRARWLALLVLSALLLTQFGAIILVPPLLVSAVVIGWLTSPSGTRPWFTRRVVLVEAVGLAVVAGMGVLVKRLGRPLGAAPLSSNGAGPLNVAGGLIEELVGTVSYQAGVVFDSESTIKFLARQFGVPHHLWLTLVVVVGGLIALVAWLGARRLPIRQSEESSRPTWAAPYSFLYLWLVFGLIVLQMVILLEPWRRNPRYLVMALPLFYLIVGGSLHQILTSMLGKQSVKDQGSGIGDRGTMEPGSQGARESGWYGFLVPALVLLFVLVQAALLAPDLRVAFRTPEPAYEEAFAFVSERWAPGDLLLTMNTSGAGLLMGGRGHPSAELGFAVQEDAQQFLLNADTRPVDRWLGAPWVGTVGDFNRALNQQGRTWFVVDSIRLPVYYRGDWLAVLHSQMELVWSKDDALVYLTRPERIPVPADPEVVLDARFGGVVALGGYGVARRADFEPGAQIETCAQIETRGTGETLCLNPGDPFQITLFWKALAPMDVDYTVFLHVRDEHGQTLAQRDSQPFDGLYPTSQWQPGEIVAHTLDVDLPPDLAAGPYSLSVGLYRLDTMARLPLEDDTSGENAFILDDALLVVSGDQGK